MLEGRYPEDGLALYRAEMPAGWEADLPSMRQPIDFLGLNLAAHPQGLVPLLPEGDRLPGARAPGENRLPGGSRGGPPPGNALIP